MAKRLKQPEITDGLWVRYKQDIPSRNITTGDQFFVGKDTAAGLAALDLIDVDAGMNLLQKTFARIVADQQAMNIITVKNMSYADVDEEAVYAEQRAATYKSFGIAVEPDDDDEFAVRAK